MYISLYLQQELRIVFFLFSHYKFSIEIFKCRRSESWNRSETVREYKFESEQPFKKSKCLSSHLKSQNWVTEKGEFLELNVQPH